MFSFGMSRKAVHRYLSCEQCPDWRPRRATRSAMDLHRDWIDARIAEGRFVAVDISVNDQNRHATLMKVVSDR